MTSANPTRGQRSDTGPVTYVQDTSPFDEVIARDMYISTRWDFRYGIHPFFSLLWPRRFYTRTLVPAMVCTAKCTLAAPGPSASIDHSQWGCSPIQTVTSIILAFPRRGHTMNYICSQHGIFLRLSFKVENQQRDSSPCLRHAASCLHRQYPVDLRAEWQISVTRMRI